MNISKPQVQDAYRGPTTYHKIKILIFYCRWICKQHIHIVTHGKGGSLKCDRACVNSSTKICEHVLAVAQVRGSINELLAWYRSKRRADTKEGIIKDKVLDMALGNAPKSTGKKPSNRKKSNSQKPVTETRDLLEGNRSVFVNPQAPVFPLNVAPVPILPAIQQQTENNRLNSLFPEAAPHQPVIQTFAHSPFPHSPVPHSPVPPLPVPPLPVPPFPFPHYPFPHYPFSHSPFRVLKIAVFSLYHVFRQRRRSFCLYSIYKH